MADEESESMKKYLCLIKVDARNFKKWAWDAKMGCFAPGIKAVDHTCLSIYISSDRVHDSHSQERLC